MNTLSAQIAPVVKLSLTLPQNIHDGLQREAKTMRRETSEHIQRILAEHAIKAELLPEEDVMRLEKTWSLVAQAVDAAQRICRNGGFSSSITLDAIRECMKDPRWVADYREVVGDDIYKNGNPRKGPVNREIGYRIRAGIGGTVEKLPNGNAAVAKVLGEIIQSYTPMKSFDPTAVA